MRTEEKVFFGIGTASFLLMLSDLLLEVFSASLFIGSKRLISYIGILIIVCAVSFTVLCFLVVKNHRGRFKSKGTRIYSPFLMSARGNGKKVVDMADENGDIDVIWTDGGCLVSYKAYKTDATSVDDTETITLRFFYNEKSGK